MSKSRNSGRGGARAHGALALLAAVAIAALLASGCGDQEQAAPAEATVDIVGFRFEPETVELSAGGEVRFENGDAAPHTATADDRESFDTGRLSTGETGTLSFEEPGTYAYFCVFHPFMRGSIEVIASPG